MDREKSRTSRWKNGTDHSVTKDISQAKAARKQQGAISHKAALPQLVAFQQSPDEHFKEALRMGGSPTPTELTPASDKDF